MWLNGLAYQQLALRFSQINQNLNEANATCTHLQKNLDARKEELMDVKERYEVADTSLKYEFKCHKETEKSLAHERSVTRELVKLLNDVKLPEPLKSNQIGLLFRETQDMRHQLHDSNQEIKTLSAALENKQEYIKKLEAEKSSEVAELEEQIREIKSEYLNFMSEGDDISIETAT